MNQLIKFSSLGFLLLTLMVSSCGTTKKLSTKEALLRFQPKKSDTYGMSMNLNMNMEGAQSMNMNMTMHNNMKIGDVEKEGAFYLDNMISKMTMSMKNPMMNIDYDSDNVDTNDPGALGMHEAISKMLNVNMTSKLDNRGKILETPDYSKIFGDDPALKGQVDQMNTSLQSAFIAYPEKAVKVGESWNGKLSVEGQMPMDQEFTYTVKEITLTDVTLDVTGVIKMKSDMVTGGGTMTGVMFINRMSGFITTSNIQQNMTMSAMGMDMKIINDIKITMVKK